MGNMTNLLCSMGISAGIFIQRTNSPPSPYLYALYTAAAHIVLLLPLVIGYNTGNFNTRSTVSLAHRFVSLYKESHLNTTSSTASLHRIFGIGSVVTCYGIGKSVLCVDH